MMAAPAMMIGTLMISPMHIRKKSPLAAAVMAMALSRLITVLAKTMVQMARPKLLVRLDVAALFLVAHQLDADPQQQEAADQLEVRHIEQQRPAGRRR